MCVSRRVEGSLINDAARLLRIACGLTVLAILTAKIPLIWRINVNWDEFYFLSHVHSLARGELDVLLQGAYTHLFLWATWLDGDEMREIVLLRLSLWPLLALSCFLLYRLARRWASATAAWFAVLAFLASWPVLAHGLSFRVDSLLLPLTLAAFLLASGGGRQTIRTDLGIGLLLGVASALTLKAVLLLPALMAVLFLEANRERNRTEPERFVLLRRLAWIAGAGGIALALILAAHANFVFEPAERPDALLTRTLDSALFELPWAPRWLHFQHLLARDLPTWLLLVAGLAVAILRRRFGAAACALALLPILVYRNAYPYYYVVMLAPAAVLIAVAVDQISALAARTGRAAVGTGVIGVIFVILAHDAWDQLMTLRFEEQAAQRSVIAAVHRIFPEPVPYIDHSGMIASFPKANFFMSSWGMDTYAARGEDFMPAVLAAKRPPLLLVNHAALTPRSLVFRRLSERDQTLILDSYVEYWGPVRVAGSERMLLHGGVATFRLPFAGLYRIESDVPVLIDGRRFESGDRIEWSEGSPESTIQAAVPDLTTVRVRIVWAAARQPPDARPPTRLLYYSGL